MTSINFMHILHIHTTTETSKWYGHWLFDVVYICGSVVNSILERYIRHFLNRVHLSATFQFEFILCLSWGERKWSDGLEHTRIFRWEAIPIIFVKELPNEYPHHAVYSVYTLKNEFGWRYEYLDPRSTFDSYHPIPASIYTERIMSGTILWPNNWCHGVWHLGLFEMNFCYECT